ncbi:Hypothetical protein CINCED_3A003873 [Cinara cedri]|uniref:Uncharacterized protein n=1 Tax=Cinara cedri TaxID=506608 RepID=A0A5E4M7V0_9HEMI|nr:Hypothetical protein CINCED_3A003873 [Cinara cedri]
MQSESNANFSSLNTNLNLNLSGNQLPCIKQEPNINVKDNLRQWVLKHNISHNATNSLNDILKEEVLNIPQDVCTLMKTPEISHEIVSVVNGSYIHLGIKNMLVPVLKKYFNMINNCDGVLILVINCQPINKYVLPGGIFHGLTKPASVNEFFQPFLDDFFEVSQNSLCVNNKLFKFEIGHIICDTLAKKILLNVLGQNAYYWCSFCTHEGEYIQHRMTFPEIDVPLRTNLSFCSKVYEEYYKGDSPLEFLDIDIIKDVLLNYMHLLCIGIIKRFIQLWVKGKKDVGLMEEDKLNISKNIIDIKPYVPSEFSRQPRVLDDIDYWKATKLSFFLLYFG